MIQIHDTSKIESSLLSLGFKRLKNSYKFRRKSLVLQPSFPWWKFSARRPRDARGGEDLATPVESLETTIFAEPTKPGLWKPIGVRGDERMEWRFDLPSETIEGDDFEFAPEEDDSELESASLAALLVDWAQQSLCGTVEENWVPPAIEQIEQWAAKQRLTVQSGPWLRQGEIICQPKRLAVSFPLLTNWPSSLSAARQSWLLELLRAANSQWRMVRIRIGASGAKEPCESTDAGQPETVNTQTKTQTKTQAKTHGVFAELDLTGAPHTALESLLKIGVDGLREVVSWLLWPAGFLADPNVTCSVWEIPPQGIFSPQKEGGTP